MPPSLETPSARGIIAFDCFGQHCVVAYHFLSVRDRVAHNKGFCHLVTCPVTGGGGKHHGGAKCRSENLFVFTHLHLSFLCRLVRSNWFALWIIICKRCSIRLSPEKKKTTVKKQKCPDFSIGATQKDSHIEPKISIFPPNLRVRRTCTSTYKWVDALEVDAGMPQNQFEYNMDIRKKQVLRQLFSFLFVPGAAPAW